MRSIDVKNEVNLIRKTPIIGVFLFHHFQLLNPGRVFTVFANKSRPFLRYTDYQNDCVLGLGVLLGIGCAEWGRGRVGG